MHRLIHSLSLNPKKIFLIDGLGASTTAILLLVIKNFFIDHFGMPPQVFTILATIAFLMSGYSLACCLLTKTKWKTNLRVIGTANLLYCCLTLLLVMYYYMWMTAWGITYFLVEMVIIVALALLEFKTASLSGNSK